MNFLFLQILFIKYGYIVILAITFLLLPLVFLKKLKSNFRKILGSFFINLLFFIIFVFIWFWLQDIHIEIIEKNCFEYPVMTYRENIDQACYLFKPSEYIGIGWVLKAIFWSFVYLIYLSVVYIIYFVKNMKNRK